jgi:hypothetical protein
MKRHFVPAVALACLAVACSEPGAPHRIRRRRPNLPPDRLRRPPPELKTYDVTSSLGTIKVPTLDTVGEVDEADPETIRRFGGVVCRPSRPISPGFFTL